MTLLTPAESRFPLTRGRVVVAATGDRDTDRTGRRPFGLRFFVRDSLPSVEPVDYCETQQVAVDERGAPIVHHPTAGWYQSSTGNLDGNEETKMDRDPDSN